MSREQKNDEIQRYVQSIGAGWQSVDGVNERQENT